MRVLCLDDDNHAPCYVEESTVTHYNVNSFIKRLCRHRDFDYAVRYVNILDHCLPNTKLVNYFELVEFGGAGYLYEEFMEAFDALWNVSDEI